MSRIVRGKSICRFLARKVVASAGRRAFFSAKPFQAELAKPGRTDSACCMGKAVVSGTALAAGLQPNDVVTGRSVAIVLPLVFGLAGRVSVTGYGDVFGARPAASAAPFSWEDHQKP